MTTSPSWVEPCLWPDGPAELDRQLDEAEAGYWSRADMRRVPPQVFRRTVTVPIHLEGVL